MAFYQGSNKIVGLYQGSHKIVKVYQGTNLIYEEGEPYVLPDNLREVSYLEGNFNNLEIASTDETLQKDTIFHLSFLTYASQKNLITFVSGSNLLTQQFLTGISSYSVVRYGGKSIVSQIHLPVNNKHDISYKKNGDVFVDGNYISNEPSSSLGDDVLNSIYLSAKGYSFRLYGIKITRKSDNKPLIWLVPCFNLDNAQPCFYNVATQQTISVPSGITYGAFVNLKKLISFQVDDIRQVKWVSTSANQSSSYRTETGHKYLSEYKMKYKVSIIESWAGLSSGFGFNLSTSVSSNNEIAFGNTASGFPTIYSGICEIYADDTMKTLINGGLTTSVPTQPSTTTYNSIRFDVKRYNPIYYIILQDTSNKVLRWYIPCQFKAGGVWNTTVGYFIDIVSKTAWAIPADSFGDVVE